MKVTWRKELQLIPSSWCIVVTFLYVSVVVNSEYCIFYNYICLGVCLWYLQIIEQFVSIQSWRQQLTQLNFISCSLCQTFNTKVVLRLIAWNWLNILIPDTVAAYESGELARILGIAVEDKDDLWTKAPTIRNKPRQFIAKRIQM